ncbi:MAG: hypothetical protein DDT42_00561 [candidate division WS2 bacterium]|uniref:Uncharacterized protein n=1 Tax=Psychracetigena formicireducens TaxID=2986056 RepID=A0A9E2BIE3_PSYF1|nr:hypothetical protein [Candidatus Psychracetigena formicireducens]MBT9144715.1 hypothetical protein [Candidatus Psychracetigena formicireducens]
MLNPRNIISLFIILVYINNIVNGYNLWQQLITNYSDQNIDQVSRGAYGIKKVNNLKRFILQNTRERILVLGQFLIFSFIVKDLNIYIRKGWLSFLFPTSTFLFLLPSRGPTKPLASSSSTILAALP